MVVGQLNYNDFFLKPREKLPEGYLSLSASASQHALTHRLLIMKQMDKLAKAVRMDGE